MDAVLYRLRTVAAPLFDHYGIKFSEDWQESRALRLLLSEVIVVVKRGVVVVTNKATGGVIFQGPLSNLAEGVFSPQNVPGGATTPPACVYTTGQWGACQADGTQSRTVAGAPSGCTGTPPASIEPCTYVPPGNTCTAFTYGAWTPALCPASGQQSRALATSTPSGCAGGAPVLTQACTPPLDGGALYTQYCSSCHGTSKKGSAAATIQGAINSNRGGMGTLSFLTAAQVLAISTAP